MIFKSNAYRKISLDLIKGRRIEKTHFQFGEDEIFLSSSIPKTLTKLEGKNIISIKKVYQWFCLCRNPKRCDPPPLKATISLVFISFISVMRRIVWRG